MRVLKLFLILALCVPALALADITRLSPPSIRLGNVEEFLTIYGSGLLGSDGGVETTVRYNGPGGDFVLEPGAINGTGTVLSVWIPIGVAVTAGQYEITVTVRQGELLQQFGPLLFQVIDEVVIAPPLLFTPEAVMAEATDATGANVPYEIFAMSQGGTGLVVNCSPPSGSRFPMGASSVSCTATDSVGSASASFGVFVADTTRPVLTVPANITTANPVVTFSATATDAIDGAVAVSCSPASGSTFPTGVTFVQCSTVDAHVNPAFGSFKVTVTGGVPILSLPDDITAEATGPAGVAVSYTATADGQPISCSPASGSMFGLGPQTVGCSATNAFGTTTGSFTVLVQDTTPPTLTVPTAVNAQSTSPSGAAVTFVTSAIDLVEGAVSVFCSPASGSTFPLGATTVNCVAFDSPFNVVVKSFQVTVIDATPPTLVVSPDLTREATSPAGASVTYVAATATDAVDGSIPATCAPASGTTFALGTTTVTCSATNSRGITATKSFTITVVDTTPPALVVSANVTNEATSPSGASVTYTAAAAIDLVDGIVPATCTPASGSTFGLGATTVSCSASDSRGNAASRSFTITVVDTTPPALVVSADVTKEATSPAGASVTYTAATATDLVDGTVSATCTPASGSTFGLGATTVSCSASDSRGNAASSSFQVTVVDTTPPVLTLPADITKEATSPAGATVTYTAATATDLVDGTVSATCTPASGSTFGLGATTVTCSASDSRNNAASKSFQVTVVDTTPPVLALPSDITREATSPSGATVTFPATAADLVDGSVAVTCTPASGSTFALGTTPVTCKATDTRLNGTTGGFNVTIVDTTAPVVSLTASPNSLWPPNHQMVLVTVSVAASDIADPNVVSTIVSVSSNQPINGTGDGDTAPDWNITGPLTVQLRSERAGGADRVYTITVRTVDASGNAVLSTVEVRVSQSRGRAVR